MWLPFAEQMNGPLSSLPFGCVSQNIKPQTFAAVRLKRVFVESSGVFTNIAHRWRHFVSARTSAHCLFCKPPAKSAPSLSAVCITKQSCSSFHHHMISEENCDKLCSDMFCYCCTYVLLVGKMLRMWYTVPRELRVMQAGRKTSAWGPLGLPLSSVLSSKLWWMLCHEMIWSYDSCHSVPKSRQFSITLPNHLGNMMQC